MADAFGHRFLSGTAEVHPEVLAALAHWVGSREGAELRSRMQGPLQELFRTTREVLLVPTTETGMMEAAIRCGVEERVLIVIGGAQGERFAQVAEACGKEVVRAMVPPGRTLEAEHLAQFLDGPEVDAVALVHAETSTGALTPLAELARVIRARTDVHILVDAAGSLGGCPVETDLWSLDFVFAGTDLALALPSGLALGVVSRRLIERAGRQGTRGQYFDLARLAQPSPSLSLETGPAIPQCYALAIQLERIAQAGGIETRWARHHAMLKLIEEWVLVRDGFEFLAPEGRRAWTVSCLRLPPGVSSQHLVSRLAERGWGIDPGYGALRESTVRIGHMGDVTPVLLGGLLADLSDLVTSVTEPVV